MRRYTRPVPMRATAVTKKWRLRYLACVVIGGRRVCGPGRPQWTVRHFGSATSCRSADPEAVRFPDRLTPGRDDRLDIPRRINAAECVQQRSTRRPLSFDHHTNSTVDQVRDTAAQSQRLRPGPHPIAEADTLDPPLYARDQPGRIVHPASQSARRVTAPVAPRGSSPHALVLTSRPHPRRMSTVDGQMILRTAKTDYSWPMPRPEPQS